jgi:hypothetical protein
MNEHFNCCECTKFLDLLLVVSRVGMESSDDGTGKDHVNVSRNAMEGVRSGGTVIAKVSTRVSLRHHKRQRHCKSSTYKPRTYIYQNMVTVLQSHINLRIILSRPLVLHISVFAYMLIGARSLDGSIEASLLPIREFGAVANALEMCWKVYIL